MKLLKLEIENVRGIKKLVLDPEGQNVVIWGPNGSGKSAVVDAIEFLFTGKISRLLGSGTSGVSLAKHGPHIDHEPKEALVRAVFKVSGADDPIQLERRMSTPAALNFPKDKEGLLNPLLYLIKDSKHVLSRREIIRFVAVEPGERAKQVQALLHLDEIESLRQILVSVQGKSEQERQNAEAQKIAVEARINQILGLESFKYEGFLTKVNELRHVLGGGPLKNLDAEGNRKDLKPPSGGGNEIVDIITFKNDITFLRKFIPDSTEKIEERDKTLREALNIIRENRQIRKKLDALRLLDIGISLLTDEGYCPLCETPWPPGELKKRLEARKLLAGEAENIQKIIKRDSQEIRNLTETAKSYIERIETSIKKLNLPIEIRKIEDWRKRLEDWGAKLSKPEENYPGEWPSAVSVKSFLADADIDKTLEDIQNSVDKLKPKVSEEQKAWEKLIELDTIWKQYQEAITKVTSANLFGEKASAVLSCFVDARDAELASLYENTENQFNEYYKQLHGEDESNFEASLKPHGPKLTFEVDFYGRGKHPPIALHSEGHQDSMGLCLYLALSTGLIKGKIDLTILDDVVMSVDSGHRRNICKLLATQFSDRQFLITTHDRTWARQLRTEGLVTKERMLEFGMWSIETGPIVGFDSDIWKRIQEALLRNDVPSAAFLLRNYSEQFFELACDNLRAKVEYKGDCRWDSGDYLPAAIEKYREYIRKAKNVARLWKQQDKFEKFEELETVSAEIIKRAQVEQWAINENVHFNRWGDFSKEDFQPLVEAFKDLFELFLCSNCGGMVYVIPKKGNAETVKCKCAAVNWNLVGPNKNDER